MVSLQRVSALAGHINPGQYGAVGRDGPSVTLAELRPTSIVQINGASAQDLHGFARQYGLSSLPAANTAACSETMSLIGNGPGKWLLTSGEMAPAELVLAVTSVLSGDGATVTDLSHARTVVRIRGRRAVDVLMKGCSADLESMQPGDAKATMLVSLSGIVHCLDGETYDVYVFRSFGVSLWEWLNDGALEYGYNIEP